MTIHIRAEIVCDWCSKRLLLPQGVSDHLTAENRKPKGWRTVQHDVYGNCTHYCSETCESQGLNEIELISAN